MTICWLMVPASISAAFHPLLMDVSPPSSADWYLGNANAQIEQFAVYDNLDGAAEALKRADVLFVGDSIMLFAFQNQEILQRFFSARGLRYFVLAFGNEADEIFPEHIMRKFDLHPKWVITDADFFFGLPPSAAALKAMSSGSFEAWKYRFEALSSLAIQRRIHTVFPYLGLQQWDGHPQWIWYRSKSDGTMSLAAWRGVPVIIPESSFSFQLWRETDSAPLRPDEISAAEAYREELERRGARLALTWVPPNPGANAARLATVLHVPLVSTEVGGLSTIDGKHLDRQSSARFSAAFLEELDKILGQ